MRTRRAALAALMRRRSPLSGRPTAAQRRILSRPLWTSPNALTALVRTSRCLPCAPLTSPRTWSTSLGTCGARTF
eukprot:493178-Alexandrium_andersonii.AAC.1